MLVAIEIVTSNSNVEGGENRCVSYQRDSLQNHENRVNQTLSLHDNLGYN